MTDDLKTSIDLYIKTSIKRDNFLKRCNKIITDEGQKILDIVDSQNLKDPVIESEFGKLHIFKNGEIAIVFKGKADFEYLRNIQEDDNDD